jgi:hypothetical protein
MPFRITPENRILYPQDKQVYTLHAEPPPVIWQEVTGSGVIGADQSLTFSTGGVGIVAPVIYSGSAALRFTMNPLSIPTGLGNIQVRIGNTRYLQVTISSDSYRLFTETGALDIPYLYTPTAGDQFYLEMAGNRLVVLLNGEPAAGFYEYITDTPIEYPTYARIIVTTPFTTGSQVIKAPELLGDWRLDPIGVANLDWTLSTGGTLDLDEDVTQVEFTAGDNPGSYTITAQIKSAVQKAATQIGIPPLNVVGLREVTVDPGEKVKFRTNYDDAQNSIVDWSVVGGGTLDNANVYTAPTAPGAYEVHAKYKLTQDEKITVTVPPVISIDSLTPLKVVRAFEIGATVSFVTNIATPTWTASAGSIGSSSGVWVAPNIPGQIVQIAAANAQTVSIYVIVVKVFPYIPNLTVPVTASKKVISSESEDGTIFTRQKSRRGRYQQIFRLTFRARDLAELEVVLEFWEEHRPSKTFIYQDLVRGKDVPVVFDGDIDYEVGNGGSCDIDYKFTLRERIDF